MRASLGQKLITYGILMVFLLLAVMPFVGNVFTSLKTRSELSEGLFTPPESWRWMIQGD